MDHFYTFDIFKLDTILNFLTCNKQKSSCERLFETCLTIHLQRKNAIFVELPLSYFHFAKFKQDQIYRISCDDAVPICQNHINRRSFLRHFADYIYIENIHVDITNMEKT